MKAILAFFALVAVVSAQVSGNDYVVRTTSSTTGGGGGYTTLTAIGAVMPVSSAQQTALDAKQATLVSATNIKTVNGSTLLGSGDLTVSSAVAWGAITGTLSNQSDLQTALNLKATLASPTFTGTVVLPASQALTTPVIGVATGTSLAVTGLLKSSSATAGIGYATGAGGAQTQATSKATTVVSNTVTTAITMNGAALAAATRVSFTFTNSSIEATDQVIVTHQSAGTSAAYTINAFPAAGSAVISVRNNTAGSLSEAIVLRVTVIKCVSS